MPLINFIRRSWHLPPASEHKGEIWLEWRNWDDFDWKVLFHAHMTKDAKWANLGMVSLAVLDADGRPTRNTWLELCGDEEVPAPRDVLEPSRFASLGRSIDYYQWFLSEERVDILKALADLCHPDISRIPWEGLSVVLNAFLRQSDARKAYDEAPELLKRDRVRDVDMSFTYQVENCQPLNFAFDPGRTPARRVHVLVGPNGTGKTHLLFQLAEDFARYQDPESSALSHFPVAPARAFSKQILVTNSPYDIARRPNLRGLKSFTLVGLKFEPVLDGWERSPNQSDEGWTEWLTNKFRAPSDLRLALQPLPPCSDDLDILLNPRFSDVWEDTLSGILTDDQIAGLVLGLDTFESLSSGQQTVLRVLAGLASGLDEESIVLIDEPEQHLHPHLLGMFSRALHRLLHSRKSFAIMATHSPALLRDIPGDCVTVLQRVNSATATRPLGMQSLGASIPALSQDVFGADPEDGWWAEVFHSLLDVERRPLSEVRALFDPPLQPEVVAFLHMLSRELGHDR